MRACVSPHLFCSRLISSTDGAEIAGDTETELTGAGGGSTGALDKALATLLSTPLTCSIWKENSWMNINWRA